MTALPIMETVRAAVGFQIAHWRRLWGVGLLFWPVATLQVLGGGEGDAAIFFGLVSLPFALGLFWIGYGALMRLALADDHPGDDEFRPGLGGLQIRRTEWRLLGVAAITWAALLGVLVAVTLIFTVLGGLLSAFGAFSFAHWGVLLAIPGMIYLALRLGLAGPATVDRKRTQVWRTWPMTRGKAWPLLLVMILIGLVGMIEAAVVAMIGFSLNGGLGWVLGASDLGTWTFLAVMGLITATIVVFIQLPLAVGAAAYAYRTLRGEVESEPLQELVAPAPV